MSRSYSSLASSYIRLSALAATVLGNEGLINFEDLKLYRPVEYHVDEGPPEPISGGAAALIGTLSEIGAGVVDMPAEVLKAMKFGEYKKKDTGDNENDSSSTPTETLSVPGPSSNNSRSPSISTASFVSTNRLATEIDVTKERQSMAVQTTSPTVQSPEIEPLHGRAMSSVMSPDGGPKRRWSLSRDNSRSNSPKPSPKPSRSDDCHVSEVGHMGLESILGATKAGGNIVKVGLKSPMDFTMSLAQGFHNAPKLYGDTTVRKPARVTDFQSGLKAAGKEFGYGFYDGITGLVTQPLRGARKEGAAGFAKGMVRGAFGLVLKPGASIWGLPGYTFKGIYMELTKHFGSSTQNYIIAARTAQGFDEWKSSDADTQQKIIKAWKSTSLERKRGKQKYGKEKASEIESHILRPTPSHQHTELVSGFKNTKHLSFDERKELDKRRQALKKADKDRKKSKPKSSLEGYRHVSGGANPGDIPDTRSSADLLSANETDFEEAIQRSITQTSRGNPQEDAMIERALRASVKALRNNPEPITDDNQDQVLQRAVDASIAEAARNRAEDGSVHGNTEDLDGAALRRALTASLEDHQTGRQPISMVENDVDSDTEDDESYQRALEASRQTSKDSKLSMRPVPLVPTQQTGVTTTEHDDEDVKRAIVASLTGQKNEKSGIEDDEDLRKAITISEYESKHREAELEKQRTEEDIIMEYIKKQSLLEEEHRQKMQQQQQ